MASCCNIEDCSLFAYGTCMVKLVNACVPVLSYSSAMVIMLSGSWHNNIMLLLNMPINEHYSMNIVVGRCHVET